MPDTGCIIICLRSCPAEHYGEFAVFVSTSLARTSLRGVEQNMIISFVHALFCIALPAAWLRTVKDFRRLPPSMNSWNLPYHFGPMRRPIQFVWTHCVYLLTAFLSQEIGTYALADLKAMTTFTIQVIRVSTFFYFRFIQCNHARFERSTGFKMACMGLSCRVEGKNV